MSAAIPLALEILLCFLVSTALLNRYSDIVKTNIVTVVAVFISWFFSFMVIILLPVDLTSTAYRQCLFDYEALVNSSSTVPTPNLIDSLHILENSATNATNNIIVNASQPNSTLIDKTILGNETVQLSLNNPNTLLNPCLTPWNYVPDRALIKLWRFIYWTSQFLTWLVLPIMQSYSMVGDFTPIDKLKSAIKVNFIYYSTIGAIFLVLLLYMIIKDGFDFANLRVIAISASNTWGLFLLVVLLGYGLVELPRSLFNRSQYSQALDQLYFKVARVNAEKCEAEEQLDDVLEGLQHAFLAISETSLLRQYLMKIVERCPADWRKRTRALGRQSTSSSPEQVPTVYTVQSLSRLHTRVKKAVNYHRQVICRWNQVLLEVIEWEDVATNQTEISLQSTRPSFIRTLPREKSIFNSLYSSTAEWYWKCLVRVWLLRVAGTIMAVLSIAIVWSEIAFPVSIFSTRLSIFALFVDYFQSKQSYFLSELFSIMSIGYLAVCAFYTIFHMKIFNVYHLAPRKQTEEYSLIFSGMLICRLSAPLCLNYLCLVHRDSHVVKQSGLVETSFTAIMGHLDLIPMVSNGLNVLLPLCISAICLAIYFNIGTHVLHQLGFEQFIQDDEMTLDWVQTGRDLVKREKVKILRQLGSAQLIQRPTPSTSDQSRVSRTIGDTRQTQPGPIEETSVHIGNELWPE